MKFDYDAQNLSYGRLYAPTSSLMLQYGALKPDYDLHRLGRIRDGYSRFVILTHVYGDGSSIIYTGVMMIH
jgi:hypothetical protein